MFLKKWLKIYVTGPTLAIGYFNRPDLKPFAHTASFSLAKELRLPEKWAVFHWAFFKPTFDILICFP
jgi:hypothetical protein